MKKFAQVESVRNWLYNRKANEVGVTTIEARFVANIPIDFAELANRLQVVLDQVVEEATETLAPETPEPVPVNASRDDDDYDC